MTWHLSLSRTLTGPGRSSPRGHRRPGVGSGGGRRVAEDWECREPKRFLVSDAQGTGARTCTRWLASGSERRWRPWALALRRRRCYHGHVNYRGQDNYHGYSRCLCKTTRSPPSPTPPSGRGPPNPALPPSSKKPAGTYGAIQATPVPTSSSDERALSTPSRSSQPQKVAATGSCLFSHRRYCRQRTPRVRRQCPSPSSRRLAFLRALLSR